MGRANGVVSGAQLRRVTPMRVGVDFESFNKDFNSCKEIVGNPKGKKFIWDILDNTLEQLKSLKVAADGAVILARAERLESFAYNVALLNHSQSKISKKQIWQQFLMRSPGHVYEQSYKKQMGAMAESDLLYRGDQCFKDIAKLHPTLDLKPAWKEIEIESNYPFVLKNIESSYEREVTERVGLWKKYSRIDFYQEMRSAVSSADALHLAERSANTTKWHATQVLLKLTSWMATYDVHKGKISMYDIDEVPYNG